MSIKLKLIVSWRNLLVMRQASISLVHPLFQYLLRVKFFNQNG
jgi:hypothetical protein